MPKVSQSKTPRLVRPASFFCTCWTMRWASSCDQVGPGVGSWAMMAGAERVKTRDAARAGNTRRVRRVICFSPVGLNLGFRQNDTLWRESRPEDGADLI